MVSKTRSARIRLNDAPQKLEHNGEIFTSDIRTKVHVLHLQTSLCK